jgi:hypothetical protein
MAYEVPEFISLIIIYWMPPTSKVCQRVHWYQKLILGSTDSWTVEGKKQVHPDLCKDWKVWNWSATVSSLRPLSTWGHLAKLNHWMLSFGFIRNLQEKQILQLAMNQISNVSHYSNFCAQILWLYDSDIPFPCSIPSHKHIENYWVEERKGAVPQGSVTLLLSTCLLARSPPLFLRCARRLPGDKTPNMGSRFLDSQMDQASKQSFFLKQINFCLCLWVFSSSLTFRFWARSMIFFKKE